MPIIPGSERDKLYKQVEKCIVETPLYKISNIEVPNGCQIFCKEEYLNPTGSHYDRFWIDYLYKQEDKNTLSITDTLIETSTGNSGASFAWACRALGFKDYHVVIPEDMPSARIEQIRNLGAKIILSPSGEYVKGLIEKFISYYNELKSNSTNPIKIKRPNHSRFGEVSINSLAKIAEESITKLKSQYAVRKLDYFITALGNGLSTVGICNCLKNEYKQIKCVGIEAASSPTVYRNSHPQMELPSTLGKTHGLIGTSPGLDPSIFPIMNKYSSKLDRVDLVDEVDWINAGLQLENYEGKFVGHTSAASFYKAMEIAKNENNKNILIVFYDPAWKYF